MTKPFSNPLPEGATIGIVGGGQLGQMLCHAAARLGYKTHIISDTPGSPACQVSTRHTIATYDAPAAAALMANQCDVVTFEFENIEADFAKAALAHSDMPGSVHALITAQDRLSEKSFIQSEAHVPVTPFYAVNSRQDLDMAVKAMGLPAVLKTRRFGYDGKGQVIIRFEQETEEAWALLKDKPCILETFIPYAREISVILTRDRLGETRTYPVVENIHHDGILHTSIAPAPSDNPAAREHAVKIAHAFDYVGTMAVEFFELDDGSVVVNEIAPRVHNSGHWTQNAGCTDQFEMHIRAVTGWPLGDTHPAHAVRMTNLIGKDINNPERFAAQDKTFVHIYGKGEARPGRKMGHVNQIVT